MDNPLYRGLDNSRQHLNGVGRGDLKVRRSGTTTIEFKGYLVFGLLFEQSRAVHVEISSTYLSLGWRIKRFKSIYWNDEHREHTGQRAPNAPFLAVILLFLQ